MSFLLNLTISLSTLITFSFCTSVKFYVILPSKSLIMVVIFYFILSSLLTSLHLLKESATFTLIFLKSWINAFSLIAAYLLSLKVVSLTDLMAKFKEANKLDTSRDSLSNLAFSVRCNHL